MCIHRHHPFYLRIFFSTHSYSGAIRSLMLTGGVSTKVSVWSLDNAGYICPVSCLNCHEAPLLCPNCEALDSETIPRLKPVLWLNAGNFHTKASGTMEPQLPQPSTVVFLEVRPKKCHRKTIHEDHDVRNNERWPCAPRMRHVQKFPEMMVFQNGLVYNWWNIHENPLKMHDLGPFRGTVTHGTPILGVSSTWWTADLLDNGTPSMNSQRLYPGNLLLICIKIMAPPASCQARALCFFRVVPDVAGIHVSNPSA